MGEVVGPALVEGVRDDITEMARERSSWNLIK